MSRIAFLLLAALSLGARAGEIYRWVDENGKTHMSDVVPEKYKASARRIDAGQGPSPQERREAEERAAADRARAKATAPASAAPAQPAAPALPVAAETECERAHRVYKESVDCFAQYVNTNGSVRAEAFGKCASVPDPSPRCGPPKPE